MRSARSPESAARVLWITLLLNLIVASGKAAYGLTSGSLAVTSDAIHSFTDGIGNLIGLIALRISMRPPSPQHPYGLRKVQVLAAAGVGLVIGASCFEFGSSAIQQLLNPRPAPQVSWGGVVTLVGTLAVNVFVATYERRAGLALGDPYLVADAAHTTSDVIVTLAVLGSQLALAFGLSWADPAVALVVLVLVGRVALRILIDNLDTLLDRAALDSQQIAEIARGVAGVIGCHRIRSRGAQQVHVDLHLTMDGALPLAAAHRISHAVEAALRQRFAQIRDVTIHLEPADEPAEPL